MHIDALNAAAALPRIEEHTVDQILDGVVEIGIRPHIGRIFTAKL